MKYLKELLFVSALAVGGFALSVNPVSAAYDNGHHFSSRFNLNKRDYYKEFGVPENPDQLLNVQGKLIIEDTSKEEVFDFLSDLENDPLIYPGTSSSIKTSGDGGVGTTYEESIYFGGQFADITATVLEYREDRWFKFKSDNLLGNVSAYKLRERRNGKTVLKLESFVVVPEGVTQEDMEAFLSLVFDNILTQLDTTGKIKI